MSHVTTLDLHIIDLDSAGAAARHFGGELKVGQTTFHAYYGKQACEHAIVFPGLKYEIGLTKHPTKPGYQLAFDPFGYQGSERAGHDGQIISQKLGGDDLPLLRQEYAAQVAVAHLQLAMPGEAPWMLARSVLEDGSIQIRATR